MNKRMKSIEKKFEDEKTIITSTSMYGSGYKKKSSISHQEILRKPEYFFDNMEELLNKNKNDPLSFSINQLYTYTEEIVEWLKDKNIPIIAPEDRYHGKCKFDLLSQYLYKEVSIKGTLEASRCLFTISNLYRYIKQKDYKECLAYAFQLVNDYSLFQYSILEGTISLGNSKPILNSKMTNEKYQKCFEYFNNLELKTDGIRKLNIGEKWKEVSRFAKTEFNISISDQRLRKVYKGW